MPIQVKMALMSMVASCIFMLLGVYFDGQSIEGYGYDDPFTLLFTFVWVGIVAWLVWLVARKRKDIKSSLGWVCLVILGFTLWDYTEYGYATSQLFELVEVLLLFSGWVLLGSSVAKSWVE